MTIVTQVSAGPGGVPNYALRQGRATQAGLEGDECSKPFHRGKKAALLLVASETIADLVAQGFPIFPGALGENVTTLGLDRHSLRRGQRYRIGEAVVQLTEVRLPCDTLSVYGPGIQAAIYDAQTMSGDPQSPRWAMSGFYAAVVEPGAIRLGDAIELL